MLPTAVIPDAACRLSSRQEKEAGVSFYYSANLPSTTLLSLVVLPEAFLI